jgi:hypothetical protein
MDTFRRAQFIVPFGVGAIHTLKGGTTVITGGLDYWYTNNKEPGLANIEDPKFDEFKLIEDQRFIRRLGVNYLMQPPEFRILSRGQRAEDQMNFYLPVPVFRFPTWHICPICSSMQKVSSGTSGRVRCNACESKMPLTQTRFIVACERGCVMDFPWREWVFRKNSGDLSPAEANAKLQYKGGNSVNDITVKAIDPASGQVIKERTLRGAFGSSTGEHGTRSNLSSRLLQNSDDRFTCPGCQPWLKATKKDGCGADLHPTLISATNAYFAEIKTSIYIPVNEIAPENSSLSKLYDLIYSPGAISSTINGLRNFGSDTDGIVKALFNKYPDKLADFSQEDILHILSSTERPEESTDPQGVSDYESHDEANAELIYRNDEYKILSAGLSERKSLKIRELDSGFESTDLKDKISKIMSIERLKETRALVGFSRIIPESSAESVNKESLLRLGEPPPNNHWLPATEVFGEGLFIQFSEQELLKWEANDSVACTAKSLQNEYDKLGRKEKEISPRFLMIHTFAHILMDQMIFDCGYSSASLRERLYVSTDDDKRMAGVLIYTAAGDSDGTLGGLIRLGKKELLEPIILKALEKATWCSSDPVCAEAEFQGTDNCNKAACHNCAIISETSCEEFNRFLDRSLVINNSNEKNIGFFNL